jgi:uncharacterized protein (DUF488 family)
MIEKVVTIGVYGFTEDGFFGALEEGGVDVLCDIRARRGVRGRAYAFANAKRLQDRLEKKGIRYVYRKELAPSEAVRFCQKAADRQDGVKKRERTQLSPGFVQAYEAHCLNGFDARAFVEGLGTPATALALLCVERVPQACHRLLVGERIAADTGITLEHLLP